LCKFCDPESLAEYATGQCADYHWPWDTARRISTMYGGNKHKPWGHYEFTSSIEEPMMFWRDISCLGGGGYGHKSIKAGLIMGRENYMVSKLLSM